MQLRRSSTSSVRASATAPSAVGASLGGGTSGALTDLLGLESECANIQAGIRQIDQIGSNPVALAALQNQQQGMGQGNGGGSGGNIK